tara:strand:- start:1509 stop:2123 length:615 start_codon:yes stop_codon:yes gene_type:complete
MIEQKFSFQYLFPSAYVVFSNINFDHNLIYKELRKIKYDKCDAAQTEITKSNKIFNKIKKGKELKNVLEIYVRSAIQEVFKYKIDVNLVNMWGTKTTKGVVGEIHSHNNFWFTCCYYPHGTTKDKYRIKFFPQIKQHYDIPIIHYNELNCLSWTQEITKGDLIVFPANINHKIDFNKSNTTRYSIAANFLPKGKIGEKDGELVL